MSPGINRGRRPIPFRLIQRAINDQDALQQHTPEAFKPATEVTITLIRTPSPRSTAFTDPFSPRRSRSSLTASTTTTSGAKSSSPTRTVFVTIVSTLHPTEGDRETSPPATKTIFLSAVPQTMLVTPSAVPMGTGLAGAPQPGSDIKRPEDGLLMNETARIFLIILGSIAGVALLVLLTIVIRKRKKKTGSETRVLVS
ncbi:hypothetical protein HBI56_054370 [Parastagonospora nodorum]|uniref:Uncharacterized protein n=1 Tax=Phaeosphaeria nodorum (strain SN15 / ATCC MYA-4574 / FGSC 10173) TaxID=321614 RepID=A0A7U2ICX1_PHANO|nr:hypothetical protein HBH56_097750 [Parastagonospora nodorum]QRD07340.1 hypothetical protein JI435_447270 [Parastagonospora nodorum SN15]KAH3930282.1 hypothetical protein HBH54_112080 [Parastagonospora nodorum]KAH3945227.1 hypothetical protein HBH53_147360 [Parastagonospora nodorum]KAH3967105.1 hypothetical protein HBH51_138760 [Parastagonospora nodorum]